MCWKVKVLQVLLAARQRSLLAEQLLTMTGSDFGISVTGVAGPSPSEGKPVGLVYIGFAQKNAANRSVTLQLSGNRESIKHKAAKSALYHLWKQLKDS